MTKKISILHIIDSLNVGGTEKQCVETAKRTDREKYLVHLVTLNKDGPLYLDLIESKVPVTEFRISGGFYRPGSIVQVLKLATFMKKKRFQVVQAYGFFSTVPGVIAAKLAGVPVIIAGKRDMNELLPGYKIKTEKWLWKFCDKIVVNAERIREYLIYQEGIAEEKVEVIYNGVDLEGYVSETGAAKQKNSVGMVANFREQKDHPTFLEAAAEVLKRRNDITFHLVGSGPLEDDMKGYARNLGIIDHVVFHGRKTGRELYDIVSGFSIFVLSATNEGVPNVILEAMALGVPVIANPSGGIPELVEEGVTGYLFPYKRFDLLAQKIAYLIDHKDAAEEMGKNGKNKVEQHFTYCSMCRNYENLYELPFS